MDRMTSMQRVLTAFDRRVPDRVPRSEPHLVPAQLKAFRERTGHAKVEKHFRSDFRSIAFGMPEVLPDYSQYYRNTDETHELQPGGTYQAEWGVASVKSGLHHFSGPLFPMRSFARVRELEDYAFPDFIRDWKHDHFEPDVQLLHGEGYPVVGSAGHIFQTAWLLRSREKLFVDFVDDPEFATALLDRVTDIRVAMSARLTEAGVDILSLADDIGMQDRLMMSPATYRRWIKPRLARVIDAARRINPRVHVMYHSDGNFAAVIPDLIEVGVTVLSTVQPECMDPVDIKRRFGSHLAFSGTIGVQSTLPFGTPDEVRRTVEHHIETVGAGGGLLVSPANAIEPEVPWENLVAMYDAIDEFGTYPA